MSVFRVTFSWAQRLSEWAECAHPFRRMFASVKDNGKDGEKRLDHDSGVWRMALVLGWGTGSHWEQKDELWYYTGLGWLKETQELQSYIICHSSSPGDTLRCCAVSGSTGNQGWFGLEGASFPPSPPWHIPKKSQPGQLLGSAGADPLQQ